MSNQLKITIIVIIYLKMKTKGLIFYYFNNLSIARVRLSINKLLKYKKEENYSKYLNCI